MEGLIKCNELSNHSINVKANSFEFCVTKPEKRQILEQEGWEFVPSKLKYSIRMKKQKTHFYAFEDRIWSLFAKMKFGFINSDNQFQLEYSNGLKKKIDVFAADEEAALVVECKSCSEKRKESYQKDINELVGIKDGLRLSAQKMFSGKPKIAFIFATNNVILSDNDRTRLNEGKIFYFSEADIEYWEQLTNHLGQSAKYQLFGKLFAGQTIPNLPHRIPAIKGKMTSGHVFYSFSIDPYNLLKMSYILHRTDTNIESSEAYQRIVSKKRLTDIGKYIDNGGYFPNSIIVNIDTKNKDLKFELASDIDHDSETSMGILHLPKTYKSIFIVDGQHRLYGYSKAKSLSHHTVPVVAFHNLPQSEQANIFVDINHRQKSVPTNLLRSIMADFNWGSEDANLAIGALKTRLISRLNFDDSSPLYKRVILTEEKNTATRCLTLETLLKWGLPSKTGYFGKIKKGKIIKPGYLSDINYESTLDKSLSFFKSCFKFVEKDLQEQWDIGSAEGGFIAMNIGITSTMRAIDHTLDYLVKIEELCPEDLTGEALAEKVIPYIAPITKYIKTLDSSSLKKLRSYFGASAPEIVMMEFLNAIHTEFEKFNPIGLAQWIKEQTGTYNQPSWDLGHNTIEPLIHNCVVSKLKQEFGEKSWWIEGIPKPIQLVCSEARINEGSTEPDWHFLNTIHYREIVEKNWNILGEYFTPPGMDNVKREKKLAWLVQLNAVRKRYSHPQRDIITEEEYNFLDNLSKWLRQKINIL
jgi:DNA sulfur modification protein DndB